MPRRLFFYGHTLQLADFFGAFDVECAAHLTFGYSLTDIAVYGLARHDVVAWREVELPELFIERHFCHKFCYELIHFSFLGIGHRLCHCRGCKHERRCGYDMLFHLRVNFAVERISAEDAPTEARN